MAIELAADAHFVVRTIARQMEVIAVAVTEGKYRGVNQLKHLSYGISIIR